MDLSRLTPSDTHSTCAYKGHASYLSTTDGLAAGRDIAWTYPEPLDDALRVRDRIAFWNERTDIRVDGELQPRPVTPWSTPAEQAATDVERIELGYCVGAYRPFTSPHRSQCKQETALTGSPPQRCATPTTRK